MGGFTVSSSTIDGDLTLVGPDVRRKLTTSPTNVSITTSTATSAEVSAGQFAIVSTIDTWVLQGGSTITAALTDYFLPAGEERLLYVSGTSDTYVAGITDAGSGTLTLQPLE